MRQRNRTTPHAVAGLVLGALLVLASPPGRAYAQGAPPAAPQAAARPTSGTLRGRVTDSESHEPIGQADVALFQAGLRARTNDDGRFDLENVPTGACSLSIVRMGYAPFRRLIAIAGGEATRLDFELVRNAVKLEEITVTPGSFSFMGQGTRQTMSREDVEAVPQIGEDIFRAVNRLPGLASNDYSAHFGIRGGRHDETLILLDGVQLYEPYHLKDFNEGAISIIDAETIDGVQLMTGGFPARYGDKRSGVFDITSRTPEPYRTAFDVGVSLMNSRAMGRGTFADNRGSWLAFGRIGYMGPVFQFIDQADLPKPDYYDVFAKTGYQLTSRQELSVEMQYAGDRYLYDIPATTGFLDTLNTQEKADTRYTNSYLWATLRSTFGARISARTVLWGDWVNRSREGSERITTKVTPIYHLTNDRSYPTYGVTQDWTLGFTDRNLLSFGLDYREQHVDDQYRTVIYEDPDDPEAPPPGEFPVITNTKFVKDGQRLSAYLSDRWRILKPLVIEAGARYDHATWTGDEDVSPRASAALSLGRRMTARAGWGYYRQMQAIDDVAALNNATTYYHSELTEQWTAGWDWAGGKGSLLRVEGYLKRGTQLRPVFRNWKGAIDAFPEVNEDRVQVFPDHNETKGVEIYLDRPVGRHMTARASYSYAIADEHVTKIVNTNNPGEPLTWDPSHPNPQDQRQAANADLTWRTGRWSLNGSFAYHDGWPATHEHLVPVTNDLGQPDQAVRPEKLWAERLPDYMRLDLRLVRKWPTHLGEFGASLEVINVTNHSNVFGYDYFRDRDANGQIVLGRGDETWFSIFPNVGVTWSTNF